MTDTQILIVGAYGQLGKALVARYPGARAVDRDELDITDQSALEAFDWGGITTILNAAAYTNVDGAETANGRRAAWMINAAAVRNLARIALVQDITLVHVSSEYVFDGTITPHHEDEPLTPLGVYAQTKAAGDLIVSTLPKHYMVRTSWLIGDGPNFVRTMMNLAAKNISPKVVNDQTGRLTFTPVLVTAIAKLLETRAQAGTYNVSNTGDVASWADITEAIFSAIGRNDLTVTGVTTAEYFAGKPGIAPRPLQSAMDLGKITAAGVTLPDWRDDLHDYIQAEQERAKQAQAI